MVIRYNSKSVLSMFIMFASIHIQSITAQTSHVVGDALGWTIPAGGVAVYTTWASSQIFMVGDILIFNFTNGKQDVAEVSSAAYGSCTFTSNPITIVNSPASITLTTTGNHYYVCTISTHCKKGQKLSINVFPADGSVPALMLPITPSIPGTPALAPASSPSSNPTMAPTVTTSSGDTTPETTSGAPSLVSADFIAIGLSFLGLINLRARDFTWLS